MIALVESRILRNPDHRGDHPIINFVLTYAASEVISGLQLDDAEMDFKRGTVANHLMIGYCTGKLRERYFTKKGLPIGEDQRYPLTEPTGEEIEAVRRVIHVLKSEDTEHRKCFHLVWSQTLLAEDMDYSKELLENCKEMVFKLENWIEKYAPNQKEVIMEHKRAKMKEERKKLMYLLGGMVLFGGSIIGYKLWNSK